MNYQKIVLWKVWKKILLVPSGKNNPSIHEKINFETTLKSRNNEDDNGITFPIPWLIERDMDAKNEGEMTKQQPFLVKENPREIDLILVDKGNLVDVYEYLPKCSGIVLQSRVFTKNE